MEDKKNMNRIEKDTSLPTMSTEASSSPDAAKARDIRSGSYEDDSHQQSKLAKRETTVVHLLRFLLVFILLMVVSISVVSVLYLTNSNTTKFEQEFAAQAQKVVDGFQSGALTKLQSMDALSTTLTAYAHASNLTWPFVTLDDSAHVLEPYLSLTGAASIVIMPIVPARQRVAWEEYATAHQHWIAQDLDTRAEQAVRQRNMTHNARNNNRALLEAMYEPSLGTYPETRAKNRKLQFLDDHEKGNQEDDDGISPFIKTYVGLDVSPGPFWAPWWQFAPVFNKNPWFVNFNHMAYANFATKVDVILEGKAAISETRSFVPGLDFQSTRDFTFTNDLLTAGGNGGYEPGEPIGYVYYPVFDSHMAHEKSSVTAVLMLTVYWKTNFQGILPKNTKGIIAVVESNAGQIFTYRINGQDAVFLGMEDQHDSTFDRLVIEAGQSSVDPTYTGVPLDKSTVSYKIRVYPSSEMEADYTTAFPIVFTVIMLFIFAFTVVVFIAYDCFVQRRQSIVMNVAKRSGKVLDSLFPTAVKVRLMEEAYGSELVAGKTRLKTFLNRGGADASKGEGPGDYEAMDGEVYKTRPIADLYMNVTCLMADMTGFTAWSSTRDPAQVFTLLETVYHSFDAIAANRKVFKVETVGDCYVACCGLPDARKDHAVVMARFAHGCRQVFRTTTKRLETKLGPDTGDLQMRFGLHSGPVTAGVLRGERSRFQLFGDTMNTVSRMEATGVPGMIHISEDTAMLLIDSGKQSWVRQRDDIIEVKGKGRMVTYWCEPKGHGSMSSGAESVTDVSSSDEHLDSKKRNLISWNVDNLTTLLKQVVVHRESSNRVKKSEQFLWSIDLAKDGGTVLDEVAEVIALPEFDAMDACDQIPAKEVVLPKEVEQQLHSFVTDIAGLYHDNDFHNFEHASHVTLSVVKMMARIVAISDDDVDNRDFASSLHAKTYGIASDPLTQFACVFSALIHDADHVGVSNAQLVKEQTPLAHIYERSTAEQNSVDLAWKLLMRKEYDQLRTAIAATPAEVKRFRQLVVNVVLATDIMDKDLKALRNNRWDKAFQNNQQESEGNSEATVVDESSKVATDRKATIVLEHLIQASDVSHTMQHWNVYRKWNENLFRELSYAHRNGRMETDPAKFWYKGEIGFLDFYIIPLAKKLKECGVFGVSSDEYLTYALSNRKEWEAKGEQIVAEMVASLQSEWHEAATCPAMEDSDELDDDFVSESMHIILDEESYKQGQHIGNLDYSIASMASA